MLQGIYAIVDPRAHPDCDAFVSAILRGGVRIVQLRDKAGVRHEDVVRLHALCAAARATLIVNDDVEASLHAHGVHVGQHDLQVRSIAAIRSRVGSRIIGVSAATPQQARDAQRAGADYLGTGPFARTSSKPDAREPIGAQGVRAVVDATTLPVAAIGGITLDDLDEVAATGARMAAVIAALERASDPYDAARALTARWKAARA